MSAAKVYIVRRPSSQSPSEARCGIAVIGNKALRAFKRQVTCYGNEIISVREATWSPNDMTAIATAYAKQAAFHVAVELGLDHVSLPERRVTGAPGLPCMMIRCTWAGWTDAQTDLLWANRCRRQRDDRWPYSKSVQYYDDLDYWNDHKRT